MEVSCLILAASGGGLAEKGKTPETESCCFHFSAAALFALQQSPGPN